MLNDFLPQKNNLPKVMIRVLPSFKTQTGFLVNKNSNRSQFVK